MPFVEGSRNRVSEDRQLALLVSSALDHAIFMLDPHGRVVTWNAGAEAIKGYTQDEIIGSHFSVFYTEADVARNHPAEELRRAIRDGRYEEEGWRVRKDGTRFWANVVITPVYDEAGDLVGFGKVSRDLTARRVQEEQMRARTNELEAANRQLVEFRRLVSSVRDYAIFLIDPSGHILSWNVGARHLKGYAADEIIGRHFSVFYTPEDQARRHPEHELDVAIREGRYEEEGWRVRKDRTRFWARVTITAIRDEDGRLTGFAKVTRDLTSQRETDLALRDALDELRVANEELDRFAAVAAHDLTDPLRTISGFAELLERSGLAPDEREYARHIADSSSRLTRMLQGLLAYARAGRPVGEEEPVDLGRAVDDALADLAALIAERDAAVTVALPAGATVRAATADVRVVLQNLLSNALRFSDAGTPEVRVAAEGGDDGWRVTVEDNGPGIAPDERERIFGAFERGDAAAGRDGYGLGLAICERLIERHGGEIGVDAPPEGGSRFWFSLRAGSRPPASSPPSRPPR